MYKIGGYCFLGLDSPGFRGQPAGMVLPYIIYDLFLPDKLTNQQVKIFQNDVVVDPKD